MRLQTHSDLGAHFGYDLYEVEVRYLVENEWATTAEDILWRRTKRGLRLTQDNKENLAHFLKDNMKDGRLAAAQ